MDDALNAGLSKLEEEDDALSSSYLASTWNTSQETLLAGIAERANCMRWLHGRCHGRYTAFNFWLSMPSIVVSALAGYATIGLTNVYEDPALQRWVNVGIGLMTLSTTVLTAVNQYMKTPQLSEAHRAAAGAYGKLYRTIVTELALRRDQRLNSTDFIKLVRQEQDRLEEAGPEIVLSIIQDFRTEFGARNDIQKPEIAGDLDTVEINHTAKKKSGQVESLPLPRSPRRDSVTAVRILPAPASNSQESP